MLAKEIKTEYIRPDKQEEVRVMATSPTGYWTHIMDDEEVPDDGTFMIVLLPISLGINKRVQEQIHRTAEIMESQAEDMEGEQL